MEDIVNTAATIIQQERTLMLKQPAGILDISEGSVQTILSKKLNISRVCAKRALWLLMTEIKAKRVRICEYWRNRLAEDETWFEDVVTMDESRMYCYNQVTKQYTSQIFVK